MNTRLSGRRSGSGVVKGVVLIGLLILLSDNWQGRVQAAVVPLFAENGKGRLSVDRRSLMESLRKDLGLHRRDRISVDSLPDSFRGPAGENVTAILTREGQEGKGRYLYTLNIMEKQVARESFYLHVRIVREKMPGDLREDLSRSGKAAYVVGESRDGGERLVHPGDSVRVTARGKGFLIRFTGISQSGGFLGDLVSVINPMSGTGLAGLVTGRDRVLVKISGSGS
ncbi:MAG: flagella basal body P-ring formation protein FlgA [Nitrospirota bacterium]|nr:flagella basal body P-ring formation protein FlgA [Nitrospirota bacterium]